jgi:flavin-dependent dehydrogenase
MPFDLLIVGAGPAGLSAAIRFAQLCRSKKRPFSCAVVDKGAEVGSHILSGNVLEPRALDELFPEWREMTAQPPPPAKSKPSASGSLPPGIARDLAAEAEAERAALLEADGPLREMWPELPVRQLVTQDRFFYLTSSGKALRMPCPPQMKSRGTGYVVSLSQLCRWLGKAAEAMGVEVLPGFAGKELLFGWDGGVAGVATGDVGVAKNGQPIAGKFASGVDLLARVTLLAEGARGSLTREAERAFALRTLGEGARPLGGPDVEEARAAARKQARALPPPPPPPPPPADPAAAARPRPRPSALLAAAEAAAERAVPPATTLSGGGLCGQTYALGLKEVWEVADCRKHEPGTVWHTIGYPLPSDVYGGGFVYHMGPEPDEEGQEEEEEGEQEGGGAADGDGDKAAAASSTTTPTPAKVPRRRRVALGLVVGLDYSDPHLNPYGEFQRFKQHPHVRALLEGGRCVQYGARVLNEGGLQSVPGLIFPGGALIGCSAGFLNVPKIKGTHTAMKSGIVAAEEAFRALCEEADGRAAAAAAAGAEEQGAPAVAPAPAPILLSSYPARLDASWVAEELRAARNIRPGFQWGLLPGLAHAALSTYVFRGKEPWTLKHSLGGGRDHEHLRPVARSPPARRQQEEEEEQREGRAISAQARQKRQEQQQQEEDKGQQQKQEQQQQQQQKEQSQPTQQRYPRADGQVSFDLPSSLFRSGTNHDHDQPLHLVLTKGEEEMRRWNYERYGGGPESRYCPAGVYEWRVEEEEEEQREAEGGGGGEEEGAAKRGGDKKKQKPRLTINAQNCLHCKACDVKDVRGNIRWTPPEGGGGPSYTIM